MDVDDEYDAFFDDLDEATLAGLDEIEQQNASNALEERPAKRQKVDHTPDFDLDELPEISVQNNFYSTTTDSLPPERPQQTPVVPSRNKHVNPNPAPNPRPHLPARHSWNASHQPSQRPTQARTNARSRSDAHPQSRRGGMQRSNSRLAIIASALATSSQQTPTVAVAQPQAANAGPDPRTLEQIDELKRKLDELHEENTKMQTALREAQDARFSREGEVSVLRQHLERAAKDHANQVERLKNMREEVDAKQVAIQKEMKAEMERLKTQLAFKQQEADANTLSFRKAPPSVRRKTTQLPSSSHAPQTPVGNNRVVNSHALDGFPLMTPLRNKPPLRCPKSPETSRKSEPALGFENSFVTTPIRPKPLKLPPPPPPPPRDENFWASQQVNRSQPSSIPRPPSPDDFLMGDEVGVGPASSQNVDQETLDEESDDDESVFDEPVPRFHRNAELTRIVLSHSHPIAKIPTLQFLIECAASKPDFESAQVVSSSISSILEVLANTSEDFGYEYTVAILTRSLLALIEVFKTNNIITPFVTIFNLLTVLLGTFPDFRLSLVSMPESENDQRSKVVILLSRVVMDHLNPGETHDLFTTLSDELFALLECLVWDLQHDLLPKVSAFATNRELFAVFFNTAQPHAFLSRGARFLALLFSYPRMYECCLTENNEDGAPPDFGRAVNLDRLCSLLIDVNRCDTDATSMKQHILMFFAALSMSHSDAVNVLAASAVFIPSLITHIAYLSRPVWEEEDEASFEPQFQPASLTIRTLNKTLSLLHHVVFNADPVVNLPDKFLRAPIRAFNGLNHSFIVTFARLSSGAAPDWISKESKRDMNGMIGNLIIITEMASELLELVVGGPEADGLLVMYQNNGQGSMIDEEEMERDVTGSGKGPSQS
ncbi:hypothetical protein V5O48_017841 [Marasmius crinis-equi]|uniref:DNA repair protein Rad26 n=1 Tax=Marasmius crinis-equi TaxID=585013 RepID=A0ABR3EMX1_9AGAR